jgi:hypothetical protein
VIALIILLLVFTVWQPFVEGEKRWATYTGELLEFDIDCEQCCHPSSWFRINTSKGVVTEGIGDCDESIELLVEVGKVYTIRIEPYAEPYAVGTGSFWAVCLDWIKDSDGNVIYGSEWF